MIRQSEAWSFIVYGECFVLGARERAFGSKPDCFAEDGVWLNRCCCLPTVQKSQLKVQDVVRSDGL